MAVTTKKLFAATTNATTTVFSPVSIQLNNQDDLDVYVTLSGGTRVLQLRQSTGSTAQSSHPQVNNTDGLYFPAVSAGTTLYNYQLSTDNNTITFNSALPQGAVVFCERRTRDADSTYTSFASGSTIRATDLNNSSTESNFTAQDGRNKALEIEGAIWDGDQISSVYVTSANIVDGTIQTADIAADQITNALIADDQIDSEHIVADSLDTEHYAAGSVDTTALGADSVTNAKIADNQIDSEHYVDLSVDTQHIANENVTTAKLANDAVTSAKLADNAVNSEHYVDGSIDHVHLANDIIDGDNIQDDVINSEHYVAGSIDHEHLANDIIDGDNIQDSVINSEHYVDGSIDHEHLANDIIDGDNIQDDVINSEHIAAGALDNEHYAAGSITSDKLNAATVVTASEQASAASNDTSFLTTAAADARFFNISTGDTIKDGDTFPDNDTTIATTAAINDRIIDLVDDVGGFVPIANETSFPNTNPDVNNGTGTIVSVSTLSNSYTSNGSGTFTISNGTVGNSTVTINGAANNTTYSAGYGLLVETTTTLNTYTYHRLVPKPTEITTVAGKATEIGRLGTAAAVEDMSILGTADVVADLNTLGTADVVSDLNTLGTADVVADMNTLAVTSVINDMDTVATNVTNVNNVGGSIANVNTTAGSIANVNTVATNIANVNTTAGSISNVNTVGGAIANVNTTAANIADVNNFAGTYQIASSNPSTDGSGNALAEGDLYFNTTSNELQIYNGSSWQGGVTAGTGFASSGSNTFTGNQTIQNTLPTLYFTDTNSNDDFEIRNDNGTFAIRNSTDGNDMIRVASDNTTTFNGNSDFLAGVDVTGNITVSGNVDGRDVSADGTKLDGIESGSTADQTASEIVALVADQTIAPSTIDMEDNEKIKLGTGDDLQIYHGGTDSYIANANGALIITQHNNDIHLRPKTTEEGIVINNDASVDLYYDNVKKLETTSAGVTAIDGVTIDATGYAALNFETDRTTATDNIGGPLFKNASGTTVSKIQALVNGTINIIGGSQSEKMISAIKDGAVELYHDNSKKFETHTAGVKVSAGNLYLDRDNAKVVVGASDDLQIYHDGTDSHITNTTGGLNIEDTGGYFRIKSNDIKLEAANGEDFVECDANGAVSLYYDGVKQVQTTSTGITLADSKRVDFGDGSDLKIYHNGSHSYIQDDGTGNLNIQSNNVRINNTNGTENMALFYENGAVELYYNSSKKFETVTGGATITGVCTATSFAGDGSSLSGINTDLVSDTSPQLGGDLASNGNNINMADDDIINVGSSNDLRIRHNGNNSLIEDLGTGNLQIRGDDVHITGTNDELLATFVENGGVSLYHDGSAKKLETTSSGVTVTGTVAATAYTGDGSALTGVSSAEIYGLNTDANGNLIVTTTNGGADNISATAYAAFEDVVYAATGITFSVNASGNLIATI